MLVLSVVSAKTLVVKVDTSIHLPCLPCWPACLAGLPALLACLPCWPVCLAGLPALLACLPAWPAWLAGLPAWLACLPGWPACLAGLPACPLLFCEGNFFANYNVLSNLLLLDEISMVRAHHIKIKNTKK
jgi:hypothetical protein